MSLLWEFINYSIIEKSWMIINSFFLVTECNFFALCRKIHAHFPLEYWFAYLTYIVAKLLSSFVRILNQQKLRRAWKVSKYGVSSGPYFPVFNPNTGKYEPAKTPYFDTFHARLSFCWLRIGVTFYQIFWKYSIKPWYYCKLDPGKLLV